jgi:transposase
VRPNKSQLEVEVSQGAYARVKDIAAWIKQTWGIEDSEEGLREALHNLGFSWQQEHMLPVKVDSGAL